MRPTDLEALVPGLREARETEHLNRSLCFAGVPWTVAGFDLVPITPRHKLELTLVRNGFFVGDQTPSKRDVHQFLGRLHPRFTRSLSLPFLLAKVRLWFRVWRMTEEESLRVAIGIAQYLTDMVQDLPESSGEGPRLNSHYIHWVASDLSFFLRRFQGFTWEGYMDTPYLVLQQLVRAYEAETGERPTFVNKSDRLVGLWQKQHIKSNAPKN